MTYSQKPIQKLTIKWKKEKPFSIRQFKNLQSGQDLNVKYKKRNTIQNNKDKLWYEKDCTELQKAIHS